MLGRGGCDGVGVVVEWFEVVIGEEVVMGVVDEGFDVRVGDVMDSVVGEMGVEEG